MLKSLGPIGLSSILSASLLGPSLDAKENTLAPSRPPEVKKEITRLKEKESLEIEDIEDIDEIATTENPNPAPKPVRANLGAHNQVAPGTPNRFNTLPPLKDWKGGNLEPSPEEIMAKERNKRRDKLLSQARLQANMKNIEVAEELYTELLRMPLGVPLRRDVLLEMAVMYEGSKDQTKCAAIYEKFVELFPQDSLIPEIYIRIGRIYRDMGSTEMALARFYNVLNAALGVNESNLERYEKLSRQAQLEIAETHFLQRDYPNATKFFERLNLLNLTPEDQERVQYKASLSLYLQDELTLAEEAFNEFLKKYPESPMAAEVRFNLSNIYKNSGRSKQAIESVVSLLKQKVDSEDIDLETWRFWQKKSGNQLANELYEQGEYKEALQIYQALGQLQENPEWLWPILYQLGLCFEKLGLEAQAMEAFEILSTGGEWSENGFEPDSNLQHLQQLASWRLNHLKWESKTQNRLEALINATKTPSKV